MSMKIVKGIRVLYRTPTVEVEGSEKKDKRGAKRFNEHTFTVPEAEWEKTLAYIQNNGLQAPGGEGPVYPFKENLLLMEDPKLAAEEPIWSAEVTHKGKHYPLFAFRDAAAVSLD